MASKYQLLYRSVDSIYIVFPIYDIFMFIGILAVFINPITQLFFFKCPLIFNF